MKDNIFSETCDPGFFDHRGLSLTLTRPMLRVTSNKILTHNFSQKNIAQFRSALSTVNWSTFNDCSVTSDVLSECYLKNLSELIESHFPLTYIDLSPDGPPVKWFNEDLKAMRDNLLAVKMISDYFRDYTLYKTLKKEYKFSIVRCKREACTSFLSESSNVSKDSWNIVNYERNKQPHVLNKSNSTALAQMSLMITLCLWLKI